MTLILVITCPDGILMASDSQSTESGPNILTSVRFSSQKVYPLGDNILWGGSGDVGLTQRVAIRLGQFSSQTLETPIDSLRDQIRLAVTETIKYLLQTGLFLQGAPNPYTNSFLFSGRDNTGQKWILEVLSNGQDTVYERGFHAIGSGNIHAQVAHAMVGHYDIPRMSVNHARYVAYRVVDSCIETAAAGLDQPVQLAVIPNGIKPQFLTEPEVKSIRDTVGLWKSLERETLGAVLSPLA